MIVSWVFLESFPAHAPTVENCSTWAEEGKKRGQQLPTTPVYFSSQQFLIFLLKQTSNLAILIMCTTGLFSAYYFDSSILHTSPAMYFSTKKCMPKLQYNAIHHS